MRLSVKATTIAAASVWAGGLLALGLINLGRREYGKGFLDAVSSIYPGTDGRSIEHVMRRTAWGFGDGAAGGFLFATIYNCLTR